MIKETFHCEVPKIRKKVWQKKNDNFKRPILKKQHETKYIVLKIYTVRANRFIVFIYKCVNFTFCRVGYFAPYVWGFLKQLRDTIFYDKSSRIVNMKWWENYKKYPNVQGRSSSTAIVDSGSYYVKPEK